MKTTNFRLLSEERQALLERIAALLRVTEWTIDLAYSRLEQLWDPIFSQVLGQPRQPFAGRHL
jgi:hypothetical protein